MLKKRKKRTGYKAEGIVVGGQAAPAPAVPKPVAVKDAPPIAKPSSRMPALLKKKPAVVAMVVLAVVAAAAVTVPLVRRQNAEVPVEPDFSVPKDTPGNELPNLTQAEIDQARITEVMQGTLVAATNTALTVKNNEGAELKLALTSATAYKKGVEYADGAKAELAANKPVQIVYDKSKNEAVTVWYDFQ